MVFAKVARADYPQQWPALFADVTSRAQSQSTLATRRVYLVLHHTLKELSSKRLAAGQQLFTEVCLPRLTTSAHLMDKSRLAFVLRVHA